MGLVLAPEASNNDKRTSKPAQTLARSRTMHSPLKNALVGATALLLIGAGTARAQVGLTSNVATVSLTATKEATLSVTPTRRLPPWRALPITRTPTTLPR